MKEKGKKIKRDRLVRNSFFFIEKKKKKNGRK